jgi:hypothetical protein
MTERRLIVLGAGASYAAGLPAADTVLGHLFQYAFGVFPVIPNRTPQSVFSPLLPILDRAMRDVLGRGSHDRFPLDAVCARIHDWAYEDPDRRVYVLNLLYLAICESLHYASASHHGGYDVFARGLRAGDCVITLNWDICLELALDAARVPFRRSFKPDDAGAEVLLLKPHGSVDYLLLERPKGAKAIEPAVGGRPLTENLGATYTAFSPQTVTWHELHRLRTYDLEVNATAEWDVASRHVHIRLEDQHPDYSPPRLNLIAYAMMRALRRDHFLLTPGLAPNLYRLAYEWLANAIRGQAGGFSRIIVCGYSFPPYDAPAIRALGAVAESIGYPPAEIVNPMADSLPGDVLHETFRSFTLQKGKFQDVEWAR